MSPREHARQLDAADPLKGFRAQFHALPAGQIYLDGNSLGLLPLAAEASVQRALDAWKNLAIGGWLDATPPWFTLAERLAGRVAGLIGAHPPEVAVANSTTVNLHQLLGTLYDPQPAHGRTKILAFADEFPTDLYALASHLRGRGLDPARHLVLVPSDANGLLDEDAILRALTDDSAIQLAVLPAVVYTTGQLLDLVTLTAAAHRAGVLIGYDLSHSIGVVPHALSTVGVDFAFWCHYKYLNAGPGAPGGLYLNSRHAGRPPGLAGWWGAHKDRMFALGRTFDAAEGASALQIGTPTILGLAALDGALDPTEAAGIETIRARSLRLTAYLMAQLAARLPFTSGGFRFANPQADHPARRPRGAGRIRKPHASDVRSRPPASSRIFVRRTSCGSRRCRSTIRSRSATKRSSAWSASWTNAPTSSFRRPAP